LRDSRAGNPGDPAVPAPPGFLVQIAALRGIFNYLLRLTATLAATKYRRADCARQIKDKPTFAYPQQLS
jgi:hypothetical protein